MWYPPIGGCVEPYVYRKLPKITRELLSGGEHQVSATEHGLHGKRDASAVAATAPLIRIMGTGQADKESATAIRAYVIQRANDDKASAKTANTK